MKDYSCHPAFGNIAWSHVQSSGSPMFDSDFLHRDIIHLTVSHASRGRDLSNDWTHSGLPIVEIALTRGQFMEMMTTPNRRSGTPCTVLWTEKDGKTEDPPTENKDKQFRTELATDLREIQTRIAELEEHAQELVVQKGTARKVQLKGILDQVRHVRGSVFDAIPFLRKQVEEHMDKVVERGKIEVEQYLATRLGQRGLDRVQEDGPKMINHDETGK